MNAPSDRSFGTVAVASSFLAIGLAAIYWTLRDGFVNPVAPPAKAALLSLFIINTPYALRSLTRRITERYWWATSYSFYWILSFLLAAIAGKLAIVTGVNAFPVLAALGVAAFVYVFADWIRGAAFWRSFVVIAGALFFSTFAAGVVWGRIYKSPLFMEMLQVNGIVHHDTLALAAIANMLRTYGMPAPGLDGIPYMAYHWGSLWSFGSLAELLGSTTLGFYNLGYVVTILPLFFGGILAFAVEASGRRQDLRKRLKVLAILLVAVIGVFPITGMDSIGVWTSNLMISESYAVGIGAALLLTGTTIVWGRSWLRRAATSPILRPADWIFIGLVLPVGIIAVGMLKISLMILGFVAAIYCALRLGLLRRPAVAAIALVFSVAVAIAVVFVSLPAHREGFQPLDFLKGFVPLSWWPFFFVAQLFWSLLYIVLRLRAEGVVTTAELRTTLRLRRILDVEVVALIAVLGIAPGLVTHIDGGSAFYFSDIQRWLSVGLVMAGATTLMPWMKSREKPAGGGVSLRLIAIVFISLPLVASLLANSVYWTKRMAAANAGTRLDAYPSALAADIPPGIRGLPRLRDARLLQAGLEAKPNYLPTLELQSLATLPRSERRRTAVFIPQSDRTYWDLLKRPGACSFSGHVAPALTGMSMVDGMPPFGCSLSKYYGLGLHEKRSRDQTAADTIPAALCGRVRPFGLSRIMTIHFDPTGRAITRVDECRIAP